MQSTNTYYINLEPNKSKANIYEIPEDSNNFKKYISNAWHDSMITKRDGLLNYLLLANFEKIDVSSREEAINYLRLLY